MSGFPVDMVSIIRRRQPSLEKIESTPYSKQRSSLEKELSRFHAQNMSARNFKTVTPDDINFLIWNGQDQRSGGSQ